MKKRALFFEDEKSLEIKNLMLFYFPEQLQGYKL